MGGCPTPDEMAGWCIKDDDAGAIEAMSMMISDMADCAGNQMACESFVGGTFDFAETCMMVENTSAPGESDSGNMDYGSMKPSGMDGNQNCLLAPGAIGAAHQAAYSVGYSGTCPGTPAEGSPYMWPMAWSADIQSQSMAFGSDDVLFKSEGRVFYRLDKNWKRSDTTYQQGNLRTIGQGPCANLDTDMTDQGLMGCKYEDDGIMDTMIHKGSKMYFITWKNDTDIRPGETDPSLIEDCTMMDLMVIGNIRPDWFLDDRGDDTDVQYIGDQHVYYADGDLPKLVKQWRKKDFASQYFVMSMQGNPDRNNTYKVSNKDADVYGDVDKNGDVHWPLILNVPGEGFGDDFLQSYKNHRLLSDDDDDLFELVENLESSGGSCPLVSGMTDENGDNTLGPPVLDVHIPSNLEVDPNSWYSNVYTFSPVWQPPMKVADDADMGQSSEGGDVAVLEQDRIRVESCYDPETKSVDLTVGFLGIEAITMGATNELPWLALGYRPSEACQMNPPDGSDTPIIAIMNSPPKAYAGSLAAAIKGMNPDAIQSTRESLWELDQSVGYSDVSLRAPMLDTPINIQRSAPLDDDSTVTLKFKQEFKDGAPEVMHLMYAIGFSSQFSIHQSRGCFDLVEFPTCPTSGVAKETIGTSSNEASTTTSSAAATAESVLSFFAFLTAAMMLSI